MEQMNGTKDDQTAETGFSLQLESSQEGHFTGTCYKLKQEANKLTRNTSA